MMRRWILADRAVVRFAIHLSRSSLEGPEEWAHTMADAAAAEESVSFNSGNDTASAFLVTPDGKGRFRPSS